MCKSVIGEKAYTISCTQYVKATHLSCLVDQNKQSGAGPLKNNLDWYYGFIQYLDLYVLCSSCRSLASIHVISNNVMIATGESGLRLQISSNNNQLAKSPHSLNSVAAFTSSLSSSKLMSSGMEALTSLYESTSTSYVSVLSKNVTDTVKSVISENIKRLKKADNDGSTFVVNGFLEEGSDYNDLNDMLGYVRCRGDILNHMKIGRFIKQSTWTLKTSSQSNSQVSQ